LPMISNFDDPAVIDLSTVQQLLANPALRSEHARQVAAFALSDPGYTGVAIDYRAIPTEQRADYTAFLTELADLLHGQNRTLTIVLPTPTLLSFDAADSTWETGGYDWPALGRIADEIIIQVSYPPSMYLSDGLVDGLLSWATSQISRSSLHLGEDALSQQEHQDGGLTTVTLSEAFSYLGSIQLSQQPTAEIEQTISARLVNSSGIKTEIGTDPELGPYLRYLDQDGKLLRTLWITDAAALRARLEIAARHNLGGVFVWNIMSPGVMPGLAGALLAYQLDQPLDTSDFNAELTWTVRGGDTVIAGGQTALDQAFQFESSSIPAILTIEAALSGQIVAHTELIVTLPQSTPTETLSPTETPAPTEPAEPTPIPTESQPVETQAAVITEIPTEAVPLPTTEPVIEAPTETAAEVSFQPTDETSTETPVETATETSTEIAAETPSETTLNLDQPLPVVDPAVLAAADTGDTFEAGVHLSQVGPVLLEAGKLHAQWIKLDITYRIGMTPGGEQRHIEDLQGAGFKVLFNVTGDPVEFANITRPDYIAEYAGYVGGLALYGADGIEVWREMNGQMTSAEYMQILAYGFAAIKNANPNTLVISGALLPTPTADTPEQSDKVYYEQLAGAGAAQYLDCIGQQYTLGTVAPSGTSGDPRGDNPVYYLPNSTDHARQAFGDTLPVCYTRFGYLSPEGYAPLPEAYAWAQNITAAQQAQWLAEAVQLSQQGNQVRMLIAWTLDASGFAPDSPESGYALIRPDGTCPACEALEPLLKPAP
ncbi:MAG: hypothetical protein HY866_09205, partial [Chloroflexi bacterium]|nr:hypothetical protein [Chloroflexota bacterium]